MIHLKQGGLYVSGSPQPSMLLARLVDEGTLDRERSVFRQVLSCG